MAKELTLFLLVVLFALVSSSQQIEFKVTRVGGVRSTWPSNEQLFETGAWIEYLIFIAIIGGGILILGLLFFLFDVVFWCCRRCTGLNKFKDFDAYTFGKGYSNSKLGCYSVIVFILYSIIIASALASIVFSGLFTSNLSQSLSGIDRTFTNVNNIMPELSTQMKKFHTKLNILSKPFLKYLDDVSTIQKPMNNIQNILSDAGSVLLNEKDKSSNFGDKINELKTYLNNLNSKHPSNPINSSNIPDIQTTIQTKLEEALKAVDDAQGQITRGIETYKSNINTVRYNLNNLASTSLGTTVKQKSEEISQPILKFQEGLDNYLPTNIIFSVVNNTGTANITSTAVQITFFIFPLLLYFFVLVGVYKRKKWLIKIPACITLFLFSCYFLFAAVQISFFIVNGDTCNNVPTKLDYVISKAVNETMGRDPLLTFGTTMPIALRSLLTCNESSNSFKALFGSYKAISEKFGLDKKVSEYVKDQVQPFNMSSYANNIKKEALKFTSSSLGFSFNIALGYKKQEIEDLEQNIQTTTDKETSNIKTILNDLNSYSSNKGITYTLDNIKDFDPNKTPYNGDSTATDLKNRIDDVYPRYQQAKNDYDNTLPLFQSIKQTLNDINQLYTVLNTKLDNDIFPVPDSISSNANLIVDTFSNVIDSINKNAGNFVLNSIGEMLDATVGVVKCGTVGILTSTINDTFCNNTKIYGLVLGLTAFITGFIMAIMFIVLLILDKVLYFQIEAISATTRASSSRNMKQFGYMNETKLKQLIDSDDDTHELSDVYYTQ
ncbi:hypothetical protein ABK040_006881 [Willaertia magna]